MVRQSLPCALAIGVASIVSSAVKPNVVFILSDDLGYNEMGFMNSTRGIISPNLDALALQGVILKNYYMAPICSPSRAALMTGRLPLSLGLQSSVIKWDTPWAIDTAETFLPQNLKDAGYDTAMFGKWHLGMFRESAYPRQRGFDEHIGYLQGCGSKGTHIAACCQESEDPTTGDLNYTCAANAKGKDFRGYDWFKSSADGHSEPDFTVNLTSSAVLVGDAAVDYIGRKAGTGRPFFLYLPFQNIHKPYTVEPRFRDLYEGVPGLTEEELTMFGYISEMDEQVGRVVDALKASPAVYENTIIVYSSDNGAPHATGVDHAEDAGTGLEKQWFARNYPFRGEKVQLWEGGCRVPGFVHSPLLPNAAKGSINDGLFHVTDWLPTIVGLAGGDTVRNRDLAGHDVWQALIGQSTSPRTEIIYNVNPLCYAQSQASAPKAGIRMGKWKLLSWCYSITGIEGATSTGPVAGGDGEFKDGPVLFDLEADPRETTNLAAENPGQVTQMLNRLKTWAESSVQPQQWTPPYQGEDYFCKDCPLHPGGSDPLVPWAAWISDEGTGLKAGMEPFADHAHVV